LYTHNFHDLKSHYGSCNYCRLGAAAFQVVKVISTTAVIDSDQPGTQNACNKDSVIAFLTPKALFSIADTSAMETAITAKYVSIFEW
jgi:hypothetical protein